MPCIATIVIRADRTATPLVTAARNAALDTLLINRGPAGPDTATAVSLGSLTAGATLSGGRLVYLDGSGLLYYADGPGGQPALGFLRQSVDSGQPAIVYQSGRLTGMSSLTPGATYWLGANGLFSPTPPATGGAAVQIVGHALTASVMAVDIDPAVYSYSPPN
jgi:hypothetical protein